MGLGGRDLLSSFQCIHALGLEPTGRVGDPPKNWEMRLDGKSRGDRFAEGGARSGTMTPMSSVCH